MQAAFLEHEEEGLFFLLTLAQSKEVHVLLACSVSICVMIEMDSNASK